MGGVGVVSASYLTAPFYNPALTAIYRRNDDAGMLLPSFGLTYNNEDDLVDEIDTLAAAATDGDIATINTTLAAMQGDELQFELGGAVAFGIPNQFLAANVFAKAYTESYITPDVWTSEVDAVDNAELTAIKGVTVAVTELGIALAKYQTFMGQHIAFGVSPKLQRIYTYNYIASASNYDTADLRENDTGKTILNVDAGAVWFYGPFRAGISAKNMVPRSINTVDLTQEIYNTARDESRTVNAKYKYEVEAVYTVGAGIVADYFTLSVDYDLNEATKFSTFNDNVQMIRVGGEVDLLRQLQVRAGYYQNLAYSDSEGTITAGIGLSPLNLFELDLSANYTNENSMGASINFLASY